MQLGVVNLQSAAANKGNGQLKLLTGVKSCEIQKVMEKPWKERPRRADRAEEEHLGGAEAQRYE